MNTPNNNTECDDLDNWDDWENHLGDIPIEPAPELPTRSIRKPPPRQISSVVPSLPMSKPVTATVVPVQNPYESPLPIPPSSPSITVREFIKAGIWLVIAIAATVIAGLLIPLDY